jgi:integrase
MKLTDTAVRTARIDDGKSEKFIFDDDVPGLALRLRQGGSKTFVFQYRLGQKQRRMALGVATASSVSDVRKLAQKLYHRVQLGQDPAGDKADGRAQAAHTFKAVAEDYLEDQKSHWRPRTYPDVARHLLNHARPLHQLQLGKIKRADIATLHASVTKKVGMIAANRVRDHISGLYTWAIQRGRAELNPVTNSPRHEETSRDRVLTPAELRLIWANLGGDDYGTIIKLVALTGQRPGEIAGLRWSQIHGDVIILEGGDATGGTKNYVTHVVPLSEPAKAIIAQLKPRHGRDLVFGWGAKPWTGWTPGKTRLNERILKTTGNALKDWRPHDFRRTFSTLAGGGLDEHQLARLSGRDKELASGLGIAPHVVEAVCNRMGSFKAGAAAAYNRSTYAREKKLALDQWAERLLAIVDDRDSKVTPIRKRV